MGSRCFPLLSLCRDIPSVRNGIFQAVCDVFDVDTRIKVFSHKRRHGLIDFFLCGIHDQYPAPKAIALIMNGMEIMQAAPILSPIMFFIVLSPMCGVVRKCRRVRRNEG